MITPIEKINNQSPELEPTKIPGNEMSRLEKIKELIGLKERLKIILRGNADQLLTKNIKEFLHAMAFLQARINRPMGEINQISLEKIKKDILHGIVLELFAENIFTELGCKIVPPSATEDAEFGIDLYALDEERNIAYAVQVKSVDQTNTTNGLLVVHSNNKVTCTPLLPSDMTELILDTLKLMSSFVTLKIKGANPYLIHAELNDMQIVPLVLAVSSSDGLYNMSNGQPLNQSHSHHLSIELNKMK